VHTEHGVTFPGSSKFDVARLGKRMNVKVKVGTFRKMNVLSLMNNICIKTHLK
jgi:hypothetical protein